jgi:hypothetical protein
VPKRNNGLSDDGGLAPTQLELIKAVNHGEGGPTVDQPWTDADSCKNRMRFLLAMLIIAVWACTAHAQSFGPPAYSVGDTWTFKSGSQTREVKVAKVGDGGVEMIGVFFQCPTCQVQMDRNLTIQSLLDASGKPIDPTQFGFVPIGSAWKFWDFPLELRKRWDISATGFARGRTANYEVTNTVESYEDLKTPAGVFKTYKVRRDWLTKGEYMVRGDFRWYTLSWFAPEAKLFVKTTSSAPNALEWELASYSLK